MLVHSSLLIWAIIQVLISGSQTKPHVRHIGDSYAEPATTTEVTNPLTTQSTTPTPATDTPPTPTLPECGGNYSSRSGTIRHPINGGRYQNNEDCVWIIITGEPIKIKIIIVSLDVEENYDHVIIRDGSSIASPVIGNFTGNDTDLFSPIEANSGVASIVFTSDGSITDTGFVIEWQPLVCGGNYSSRSGTIRHPMNGGHYNNYQDCVWTITTGEPIKITIVSLDIQDNYDRLALRDGSSIHSRVLGDFTGSNLTGSFEANSGIASIFFTSDGSVTGTGFVIEWETLECGGNYTSSSGTILHPITRGASYQNYEKCAWRIITGKTIKITIVSLDIEKRYDHLLLRDGSSIDSPLLGDFTGSNLTGPIEANSGVASIFFTSDGSVTGTGFVIKWETLDSTPEPVDPLPTPAPDVCFDISPNCATYAVQCNYSTFVQERCQKTCNLCPECPHPWHNITGAVGRCYLFSHNLSDALPTTFDAAREYCQQTQGGDLATAGYLSASAVDPLLQYYRDNNFSRAWIGATKVGSSWEWLDGRSLSTDSALWHPSHWGSNPSGDGHCVEMLDDDEQSGYINDLACHTERPFVCELKIATSQNPGGEPGWPNPRNPFRQYLSLLPLSSYSSFHPLVLQPHLSIKTG